MSDDHDERSAGRRRLDSVIPEMLKSFVEKSVERAPDNLRQFVSELKVPKEIVHLILTQIDDTKNGLFRVVAKEVRDFLEHTNFTGELEKILTTVQFEVNTTIRFRPNNGPEKPSSGANAANAGPTDETSNSTSSGLPGEPLPKPEVKTSVSVKRDQAQEGGRGRRRRSSDP